jgi:hypothetical protein
MNYTLNFHIRRLGPLAGIAVLGFAAQAQSLAETDLHPLDRTVLISGVAQTKVNPTEKPDEQKGGVQFAASLVLTDLAAAFPQPGDSARGGSVSLRPFMLADRKVPLVISVSFTGASRDRQGAQNVTYDVRILRPDGTVHTQQANLVAAQGKPSAASVRSNDALPAEAMGVVLPEKDPPGAYTVEAVVKDNLTKVEVTLKQRFLVSE